MTKCHEPFVPCCKLGTLGRLSEFILNDFDSPETYVHSAWLSRDHSYKARLKAAATKERVLRYRPTPYFVNAQKLNFVCREKRILLVAFSRKGVDFCAPQRGPSFSASVHSKRQASSVSSFVLSKCLQTLATKNGKKSKNGKNAL